MGLFLSLYGLENLWVAKVLLVHSKTYSITYIGTVTTQWLDNESVVTIVN